MVVDVNVCHFSQYVFDFVHCISNNRNIGGGF